MGANFACCKTSCCKDACNDDHNSERPLPVAPPMPFVDGVALPMPLLDGASPEACEIITHPVSLQGVATSPESDHHLEMLDKIKTHPQIRLGELRPHPGRYYLLAQTFALVRHADRLDHTEEWKKYKHRDEWPNDTPLTASGHSHATKVGHDLASTGKPFSLIISSPYYRCAQTASRIAEVLAIPIHFDLDVGEVFDAVSMGAIDGTPQHRSPKELKLTLAKEFPGVEYVCDSNLQLKVEGKQQTFPESFAGARMRFCYKVKKLVQRAASELMSIIIVSHGDALAAVLGMLEETWSIKSIGYTSYLVASREVRVLEEDGDEMIKEEPVYPERVNTWKLKVSPNIVYIEAKTGPKLKKMHEQHTKELEQLEEQANTIDTSYELEVHHEELFKASLKTMGSSDHDIMLLMSKSKSSLHISKEHSNRVHCSPRNRANAA